MKSAIERMIHGEQFNTPPAQFLANYNDMISAVASEAPRLKDILPPIVNDDGDVTYYQIMSYCSELNEMLTALLDHDRREHGSH